MYKVVTRLVALMLLLAGCGGPVDLEGASYHVGHTDARVDGMHSSTEFEINGLTVKTTHTEYYPERTTEREFEMSEDERARIDELVQEVLAETADDHLCTDSPSGGLKVELADGSIEHRGVIFCGQDEAVPLSDLLTYLTTRFMP